MTLRVAGNTEQLKKHHGVKKSTTKGRQSTTGGPFSRPACCWGATLPHLRAPRPQGKAEEPRPGVGEHKTPTELQGGRAPSTPPTSRGPLTTGPGLQGDPRRPHHPQPAEPSPQPRYLHGLRLLLIPDLAPSAPCPAPRGPPRARSHPAAPGGEKRAGRTSAAAEVRHAQGVRGEGGAAILE